MLSSIVGLAQLQIAEEEILELGREVLPGVHHDCSKFSSSSFFSVDHILIISGRVPKIDITFIASSRAVVDGSELEHVGRRI